VFGEQVASKDGLAWLDTVYADLEGEGYAVGAVDLCSAGFGAPHIRQRLYFVADSTRKLLDRSENAGKKWRSESSDDSGVEHPASEQVGLPGRARFGRETGGGLANNNNTGLPERIGDGRLQCEAVGSSEREATVGCGYTNGFWRDAEWIYCRDQKFRPIEPKSSPLATGITNRVGKLRGYGNAITVQVAQGFIESYLEVTTTGAKEGATYVK
jgi:DNA (cytosine-5)-methyltransferase 1